MSDEAKKTLSEHAADLANKAEGLREQAADLAVKVAEQSTATGTGSGSDDFLITGLSVFVLACFVGYYVVWRVTPALHSPLMGITNAISSVIIVGALIAAGPVDMHMSKIFGLLAVILASVNIFGGFIVTRRMLHMYKKKG
jgi:NAD(P) transhydrogenase subunit alpha